ncbi:hypothetical protein QAD02_010347 [Eretmocerus hayati]|uniref:Uncharacterized protein n=1 Tax=Eretmocerus hayati TaxID=131215 RepID=A0ACC2NCA1_9HYME|nr:hypothetical protein QAD02_010347 [Eretmocerus hayati]
MELLTILVIWMSYRCVSSETTTPLPVASSSNSAQGWGYHCSDSTSQILCQECGKYFSYDSSNSNGQNGDPNLAGPSHSANIFSGGSSLTTGLETPTNQRPVLCPGCDTGFRTFDKSTRQMMSYHETLPFSCSFCSRIFTSIGDLETHTKSHLNFKYFSCGVCGARTIKSLSELQRHLKDHEDRMSKTCKICEKSFTTVQNLRKHAYVHLRPKRIQCNICGRLFKTLNFLRNHHKFHFADQSQRQSPNLLGEPSGGYFEDANFLTEPLGNHLEERVPLQQENIGGFSMGSSSMYQQFQNAHDLGQASIVECKYQPLHMVPNQSAVAEYQRNFRAKNARTVR